MSMRHFMTLVEGIAPAPLNEIELGGGVGDDFMQDLRAKNAHVDKSEYAGQHELFPGMFPDLAKLHGTLAAPYKMIGKIGNYAVGLKTDEKDRTFVVFDQGTAVAWVAFREEAIDGRSRKLFYDLQGEGAQVCGVQVHDDAQGQRLSLKLYHFLLTHVYDFIIADYAHTRGGQKLWKMLGNSRAFDVRVYDPNKYASRKRWVGKDFDTVYQNDDLIPWVTLRGKAGQIEGID